MGENAILMELMPDSKALRQPQPATDEDIVAKKIMKSAVGAMAELGFAFPMTPNQPCFGVGVSAQEYINLGKPTIGTRVILTIEVQA